MRNIAITPTACNACSYGDYGVHFFGCYEEVTGLGLGLFVYLCLIPTLNTYTIKIPIIIGGSIVDLFRDTVH